MSFADMSFSLSILQSPNPFLALASAAAAIYYCSAEAVFGGEGHDFAGERVRWAAGRELLQLPYATTGAF